MKEQDVQKAIVAYLRAVLFDCWIVQSTANKPRSKIAGGVEKAMGAVKGWPDLFIAGRVEPDTMLAAFIEIKTPRIGRKRGGALSIEQIEVRDRLVDIGFPYRVIRSIDDMRDALRTWGVATKESGR